MGIGAPQDFGFYCFSVSLRSEWNERLEELRKSASCLEGLRDTVYFV